MDKKENSNIDAGASADKADASLEASTSKKNGGANGQKATSPRKIEANRRNASRSTGPRTRRGKLVVSRNAVCHGILVGAVVDIVHEENMEDFKNLIRDLILEYEPKGRLEELLVERIATAFWKLKRVLQAESGEIGKAILAAADRVTSANFHAEGKDLADWQMMVNLDKQVCDGEKLNFKLKQTETGLVFMEDLVLKAKNELETTGSISEHSLQGLIRGFGPEWRVFGIDKFIPDPQEKRTMMLKFLDHKLSQLEMLKAEVRRKASLQTDSEYRGASIPMGDAMDRILRYERHVERQLYRAMDQLERLQRKRRGETLPPPLKLEIEGT